MKIKEGAAKIKPVKAQEKRSTDELLEKYAKFELRAALQKVLERGEQTRYVGPSGFLWPEFASTITRCLHLDISETEFRRRMPTSVEWLAKKLLVVCGWDLPLRASNPPQWLWVSIPRNSIPYGKYPRKPRATREYLAIPDTIIQRVTDTLRDALGDLYGTGIRVSFVTSRGKLDWHLLGKSCGLSPQETKEVAEGSCREIVREIEDYVLSHRNSAELFSAEARLGLRPWEIEVE